MRYITIMILICLLSVQIGYAQKYKIGYQMGGLLGSARKSFVVNRGLDFSYTLRNFGSLSLGLKTGFEHYEARQAEESSVKVRSASSIPLAGVVEQKIGESPVVLGLELGYSGSLSKSYSSGLFLMPRISLQEEMIQLSVFYKSSGQGNRPPLRLKQHYNLYSLGLGIAVRF